jgi:hypothetical protein
VVGSLPGKSFGNLTLSLGTRTDSGTSFLELGAIITSNLSLHLLISDLFPLMAAIEHSGLKPLMLIPSILPLNNGLPPIMVILSLSRRKSSNDLI